MLIGEYQHTIDAKGRIIMPVKLRDNLGDKFVITRGIEKCLFVYSIDKWTEIVNKLNALPLTKPEVRRFIRFFSAGAVECEIDGQGRIVIPQNLREHATLKKQIVSIGALSRAEIWDLEQWNEYNNEGAFEPNELAEKMAEFGI